ncbi:MAG TPA: trypsin-like peptidase domain-containing protein [Candidatus Paceibacterota bacterium]|nr:trypsin-like peptidase domain-containing protein [Candidatus Paceibacterota bacterium]
MPSRLYSFLVATGVFGILSGAFFIIVYLPVQSSRLTYTAQNPTTTQAAAVLTSFGIGNPSDYYVVTVPSATSSAPTTATLTPNSPIKQTTPPAFSPTLSSNTSSVGEATRIVNPYDNTSPESFDFVNTNARNALVNILCMPRGGASFSPISGSGVIIDPRGVILTNAHVAQYVLLSQNPIFNLSCQIRTGAPAMAHWGAEVLYIPPVWVEEHASEINTSRPTGTGEHDYALLLINSSLTNSVLPTSFPYIPFDTRNDIGFLGDQVLGASYPAEFIGGLALENNLYPVSSISPIDQLLTFATDTVDVISIGGVVEAQGGSSGGAIINQWGKLIGIIVTTSDASTTAGRDLRGITLSYINNDLKTQAGVDLASFLSGMLGNEAESFTSNIVPDLIQIYINILTGKQSQ